ncbi:hypothetical protein SADUNF_Sadunf05G0090900 [Salix dunnii]|uniref:Uncharacterized protein n=1 Tax=Salix dunnii TaxID=1413687 RepID=A0A835MYV5_9ROSI|nr:hypothetical protein SADUNF_Sadunf05G0090900 [Salix dunnii]
MISRQREREVSHTKTPSVGELNEIVANIKLIKGSMLNTPNFESTGAISPAILSLMISQLIPFGWEEVLVALATEILTDPSSNKICGQIHLHVQEELWQQAACVVKLDFESQPHTHVSISRCCCYGC